MKMTFYPQRDDQRKQSEREDWRGATDTEERVLRLQDKVHDQSSEMLVTWRFAEGP